MSQDHEKAAAAAERGLADLQERCGRVGARIDDAREDWEAKKADSSVPGATGEPDDADASERGADGELPPPDPHETDWPRLRRGSRGLGVDGELRIDRGTDGGGRARRERAFLRAMALGNALSVRA